MMNGLTLIHVFVATFLVDAARLKKSPAEVPNVVKCRIEFVSVLSEGPEPADEDFAECTDTEGVVRGVDFRSLQGFEHGDVVSLRLGEKSGSTALGSPLYKVMSAQLLHHEESNFTMSAGFNILAIRTVFSDMAAPSMSSISGHLETTKQIIRGASYNTFRPTSQIVTVSVPERWDQAVTNCAQMRNNVLARTPNAGNFVYRMIFLPGPPNCGGWAGVAITGCGRPLSAPRPGACWSMYAGRWDRFQVQAHELGHNFGLGHAGDQTRDYGDPRHVMGASYVSEMSYSAPSRYRIGWLRDAPGEALTTSRGRVKLSDITESKNYPGTDGVTVRIPCGNCAPMIERFSSRIGGNIFVSLSYGKVFVHLARVDWSGTEAWAVLGSGEGWQLTSPRHGFHVCGISGKIATIVIANTQSQARAGCSGYYRAPSRTNCPPGDGIFSSAECRTAGAAVGYRFNKDVSDRNRPAGCFWDPNGFSYYNSQRPSNPPYAGGICTNAR